MIGYTTIGTNNMEKAAAFYDELFSIIGAKRSWDWESFKAWAVTPGAPMFAVTPPYNKEPATVGNGVMIALAAPDRETVKKLYDKAIELGGSSEGEPGYRGPEDMGFFAGYFRDLDGNKLNAFNYSPKKT
ncbi:VOC family protein [Kordiimonas aestuarii]|uniref:VOC family protein n=1 Tax=Kordiimonas aestuarii TaxID=1005925 RepID=UPI0021CF44C2|nr:VOC family protein [Kordiimonas aestuarii]